MPKRTYPSGSPEEKGFGDYAAIYFNRRDSALKAMLMDIWGEEGVSTGQSLFRTEDGKALNEQIVDSHDKNITGITQKKVRDHMAVAGFFEKNPTGNLLIMMKDDNEPHVLSFDQNKHEYSISEEAYKPKPLPQKPSGWDRFLGFFGNKKAKEKVNKYDTAVKDRKWYDDFKKKGKDLSKTIEKNQAEKLKQERAQQEKARQEEAKRLQAAEKQKAVQAKTAPAKVAPAKDVFATENPLLQEAYSNLKKEMAEKPNLVKIAPDIHVNTKKALSANAGIRFGSDADFTAPNFKMNVARQIAITILGDAPEIQDAALSNGKLNNIVSSIYRTDEFNAVMDKINVRDVDGSIDGRARQEKIQELIKDGGKNMITEGLREKCIASSSLKFSQKAPTNTMSKSKQNEKVLSSSSQQPPVIGGPH